MVRGRVNETVLDTALKDGDTLIDKKGPRPKMNLYVQNFSSCNMPKYQYEVSAQVYHPSISFSFDPYILDYSTNMSRNSILIVIFDIFDIETWEDAK